MRLRKETGSLYLHGYLRRFLEIKSLIGELIDSGVLLYIISYLSAVIDMRSIGGGAADRERVMCQGRGCEAMD